MTEGPPHAQAGRTKIQTPGAAAHLEQQTDEEHLLGVPQLVELLARQGILCERKSVYSDIDALNALGYDIRLRRGRSGGYWMATRPFELAELILVDAVQSSRVISKTSSDKLIHKLEGLASRYQGTQLQRQVYVDGRPKSDNKDLPYSVDALFAAINTGKMVRNSATKSGTSRPLHHQSVADGVGEWLLLSHRLSGREGAGGHPPLPGG